MSDLFGDHIVGFPMRRLKYVIFFLPFLLIFQQSVVMLESNNVYVKLDMERRFLFLYIYIFITVALDESIFLHVLHFPMKNIKSRGLEATPMGGATEKPIQ